MIDFVIEMFSDIAEVFVDLWINKIIAKFKRKKYFASTNRSGNFLGLFCGPLCLPHPAHTQLVLLPFPVQLSL